MQNKVWKKMNKFSKFLSLFSIIIFCLFLMFHIFLNIFIKSKEVKVDEKKLLNKTTVFLTDRQIEIASYILNNQQNPKFNNYIFLFFDTFSNRNLVAYLTAQIYINELDFSNKIKSIERQIIELSTKRYITKNIDYKLCYNYIFSQAYFGNNQYGLENGSQYYFKKNYKNLTEKEFVSLCLLVKNPIFYDLSKERNLEESERIYQKINE